MPPAVMLGAPGYQTAGTDTIPAREVKANEVFLPENDVVAETV